MTDEHDRPRRRAAAGHVGPRGQSTASGPAAAWQSLRVQALAARKARRQRLILRDHFQNHPTVVLEAFLSSAFSFVLHMDDKSQKIADRILDRRRLQRRINFFCVVVVVVTIVISHPAMVIGHCIFISLLAGSPPPVLSRSFMFL